MCASYTVKKQKTEKLSPCVLTVLMGEVNKFHEINAALADAKYLIPAHINLVDREDVSDAKSPRSMHATFNPLFDSSPPFELLDEVVVRVAASNAIPAPVAPPPITNISYGLSFVPLTFNRRICSARDGIPLGPGTSLLYVGCNGNGAPIFLFNFSYDAS